MASSQNMKYYDVSAKENINIDTFMNDLMQQVYQNKFGGGEPVARPTIKIGRQEHQGGETQATSGSDKKSGKKCCK